MSKDLLVGCEREVSIPEVIVRNEDGYTVYKIILKGINSSSQNCTEVWRRYSSILELYRSILKLQLHIHISEPPPALLKPSVINRFNKDVIENRRKSALTFFKYCIKFSTIHDSESFQKFFQDDFEVNKKRFHFKRDRKSVVESPDVLGAGLGTDTFAVEEELRYSPNVDFDLDETGSVCENGSSQEPQTPALSRVSPSPTKNLRHASSFKRVFLRSPSHNAKLLTRRLSHADKLSPKKGIPFRVKPGEYLKKAEKFIARFSFKESKMRSNDVGTRAKAAEEMMKVHWSYMSKYEVLGTAGDVIVANDVLAGESVAIKIVEKRSDDNVENLVLPLNVPFMAPLIRFHENDFATYLVLRFVSGGKLWNHLKKFMKRPSVYSNLNALGQQSCKYEGQRLISPPIGSSENSVTAQEGSSESKNDIKTGLEDEIAVEVHADYEASGQFVTGRFVTECKSSADDYIDAFVRKSRPKSCSLADVWIHSRPESIEPSSQVSVKKTRSSRRRKLRKCKSLNDLKIVNFVCEEKTETIVDCVTSTFFSAQDKTLRHTHSDSIPGSDTLSGLSNDFSFSSESVTNYLSPELSFPLNGKNNHSNASTPKANVGDVNNLIRDSKKLLAEVTKTLEMSKEHSKIISEIDLNDCKSEPSFVDVLSRRSSTTVFESFKDSSSSDVDSDIFQSTMDPKSEYHTLRQSLSEARSRPSKVSDKKSIPKNEIGKSGTDGVTFDVKVTSSKKHEANLSDSNASRPVAVPYQSVSTILDSTSSRLIFDDQYIPEGLIRVWISQVIMAMNNLHQQDIVWGNFGPKNLLLDEGGSLLLTYRYSFNGSHRSYKEPIRKQRSGDAWLSSLGYSAPEVLSPIPSARPASDWWSVGALLYHLLNGKDLASCHPSGILPHTLITFMTPISEEANSLILNLLRYEPSERLGANPNGIQEIKNHPFFIGLEWST